MEQLVKAIINDHHQVDVSSDAELDVVKQADGDVYHVIRSNKSFLVELEAIDRSAKTIKFSVDGVSYKVAYKDQVDVMVEQMGLTNLSGSDIVDAVAPMPGLVLSVQASQGDEVVEGQPLLILEAMKMENVIKAAHDGKIEDILVSDGDKVEKGQVLVTYEN